MVDRRRWYALWSSFGVGEAQAAACFDQLQMCYTEPHRAYHNLAHIADCLTQFDQVRDLAESPTEVEAALWFHDVIYDPRRQDNEEHSADWAWAALTDFGIATALCERIRALILATKHTAISQGQDAQLLVDIDLSILGRPPAEFDRYERAIRQEYAWVAEEQFRHGRAKILHGFLARERIYQTTHFYQRLEQPARQNLTRSVAKLRGDHSQGRL
jgi:predicted metal-dependent HD superfamily phosphohydrolase